MTYIDTVLKSYYGKDIETFVLYKLLYLHT